MLRILSVALLIALAACSSEPVRSLRALFQPSKGAPALSAGLRQYEDGEHTESAKSLQGALDEGLTDGERANAY